MLEELSKSVPVIQEELDQISKKLDKKYSEMSPDDLSKSYSKLPKIAIDNAVLEVSSRVAVVREDLGWQDVGSWDSLARCFQVDSNGNLTYGETILKDSRGLTVDTDGPLVAAIGVEDMIIVKSGNAILVCPNHKAQEVKKVVEQLASEGQEEYT